MQNMNHLFEPNLMDSQKDEQLPVADDNNIIVPVLALKGITIYPNISLTFDVGRSKSVNALEYALHNNLDIFLVSQKDYSIEEPQIKDVYQIGTICHIQEFHKTDSSTIKIVVQGQTRAKILANIQKDPFILVKVLPINDEENDDTDKNYNIALVQQIMAKLNEYTDIIPKESIMKQHDFLSLTEYAKIKDYKKFSYAISNYLSADIGIKQRLLEANDLTERLELALYTLSREVEIELLNIKIKEKIESNFTQQHKEIYLREQLKVIKTELGEDEDTEIRLYKEKIETISYPAIVKNFVLTQIKRLEKMSAISGMAEAAIIKNHLDFILSLPWIFSDQKDQEKVSASSEKIQSNIKTAAEILEKNHFGMEIVKERILEYVAMQNAASIQSQPILCLYGPPGVGKTSVAASIAEALHKKFVRISLGGIHDEAELRGHRKTYVGAMPGKILAAMKQAQTANPVILLDEIDKLSHDIHGDPASVLLELLDSKQNSNFIDSYAELPFNMSNVTFIATANNLDTIPRPLLDRLEIIELSSYTDEEKYYIAQKHLIPKCLARIDKNYQIKIEDSALRNLISYYTAEAGVRELERLIAAIIRKSILIMQKSGLHSIQVTEDSIQQMFGYPKFRRTEYQNTRPHPISPLTPPPESEVGLVNGLAWTASGGVILPIEVSVLPGNGQIEMTGYLGSVMKESVKTAIGYIRSQGRALNIPDDFFHNTDIHVHFPQNGTPKDGPSAGIAITIAILSALTGRAIRMDIAMTGEITLKGRVLPIGGVKEKLLAAIRTGLKLVIFPKANSPELEELPEISNNIQILFVDHIHDIFQVVFDHDQ